MKKILLISAIIVAAGVYLFVPNARRPEPLEQEIRHLDLAEAEAILNKDFEALDRLCAEDLTVNSPRHEIVKGRAAVKDLFRRGTIDYASFRREIETVLLHEETAIVMGHEIIVHANNGQTSPAVHRRYTNIWLKRGGQWLLTARHASIIPPAN